MTRRSITRIMPRRIRIIRISRCAIFRRYTRCRRSFRSCSRNTERSDQLTVLSCQLTGAGDVESVGAGGWDVGACELSECGGGDGVADAGVWVRGALPVWGGWRPGERGADASGRGVRDAADARGSTPAELGFGTQSLTVVVEDVEAHCARAKAGGARIVEEPHETEYGEFQYAALDLNGHHWLFSRHARDVAPKEWGAVVAKG